MRLIANILRGLGSALSPPVAPTLAVSDNGDGTGGIATISGSSANSLNSVYYTQVTGQGTLTRTLAGTRTGDGTLALTQQGAYIWEVISSIGGASNISRLVYRALTAPSTDAWEDVLATAIASELNDLSRSWNPLWTTEGVTAVRTRSPWYTDASVLKTLKVACVPLTIERKRLARQRREFDYAVLIDFQRQISPDDDANLRLFSKLAQDIHDFFDDGHELTGAAGWVCLKSERRDVYNLPVLHAQQIWETLISVDVRGTRQ